MSEIAVSSPKVRDAIEPNPTVQSYVIQHRDQIGSHRTGKAGKYLGLCQRGGVIYSQQQLSPQFLQSISRLLLAGGNTDNHDFCTQLNVLKWSV